MLREAANTLAGRLSYTYKLGKTYAVVHSDNQVMLNGGRMRVKDEHKELMLREAMKITEEHDVSFTHHEHTNGAFSIIFSPVAKRGRA